MAFSTSAYVRLRARLPPRASRARRSSALLRMASAPTSRAGRAMREKPRRSLRWNVMGAARSMKHAASVRHPASAHTAGAEQEQERQDRREGHPHDQEDLLEGEDRRLLLQLEVEYGRGLELGLGQRAAQPLHAVGDGVEPAPGSGIAGGEVRRQRAPGMLGEAAQERGGHGDAEASPELAREGEQS